MSHLWKRQELELRIWKVVCGALHYGTPRMRLNRTKGLPIPPFPFWCKGSKRRREYQAKVAISVQQDQDQQNGGMEVIMDPRAASSSKPLAAEDQL